MDRELSGTSGMVAPDMANTVAAGGARQKHPQRAGKRGRGNQADSRARVLNTARGLFARQGFESTSIRHIASELNIVSASLYHHFLTKEEILHEILRAPLTSFARATLKIASAPTGAEHRLIALVMLRIQAWLEDWEAHAIALNDAEAILSCEDFGYVEKAKLHGYHAMETILRDGMGARLFRPDLEIHVAIVAIAGLLNSAARSLRAGEVHVVEPPGLPIEQFTGTIIDFVLRLVRTNDRIPDAAPNVLLRDYLD